MIHKGPPFSDAREGYYVLGVGGILALIAGYSMQGGSKLSNGVAHEFFSWGLLALLGAGFWYGLNQRSGPKEVPNSYLSPEFKPFFKKPPPSYSVPKSNFLTRNLTSQSAERISIGLWLIAAYCLRCAIVLILFSKPELGLGLAGIKWLLGGGVLIYVGYWLRNEFE